MGRSHEIFCPLFEIFSGRIKAVAGEATKIHIESVIANKYRLIFFIEGLHVTVLLTIFGEYSYFVRSDYNITEIVGPVRSTLGK
jgi:hypothetical protein